MWSCGAGLGGVGRLTSDQRWNQTHARLSAQRESGYEMTYRDLTATAWRKAKTLSQSSVMVANISAAACFALPGFAEFVSSVLMMITLLTLLSSSASLVVSSSFAYSMMERAEIFRSSSASDYPWWMVASVKNGGRRTELLGVQSLCFLDCTRPPAAAQRRTSVIGSQILSSSEAKEISIFR